MRAPEHEGGASKRRWLRVPGDSAGRRAWAVDANDGIIATAGIVEGFAGAGTGGATLAAAAIAAMVSGSAAVAAARYSEVSAERDAECATIAEEEEQLRIAPDAELSELAELYEMRGLAPELALQVATELTAHDALGSHLEIEHGMTARMTTKPISVAAAAGTAFAMGAAIPLTAVLIADYGYDGTFTFVAVVVSLCATSFFASRVDGISTARTVTRTVTVGALTMAITYLGGTLFDLGSG